MKIELLYFDGCPTWEATLDELRALLQERGLPDEVTLTKVETNAEAERLRFIGSPTVRVDGLDVDPDVPDSGFALDCRLYWVDGEVLDAPPRAWLASAISSATEDGGPS